MAKPLRILSLGWGVQSWTLAAMVALKELPPIDYAVHADTTHEHEATYAHAKKWTPWLEEHGVRVVTVKANRPDVVRKDWDASTLIPAFTLEQRTYQTGQLRRQCTHNWKIMPVRRFIRSILENPKPGSVEMWLGISFDECQRIRDSGVGYIINHYPLAEQRITRAACIAWLEAHSLDAPPKSACTFCPYKSLESWRRLKRRGGHDWQEALAVDNSIRNKRADAGHILYVHPARIPLEEAVKIPEDIGAHQFGFFEEEQPCDSGFCMT